MKAIELVQIERDGTVLTKKGIPPEVAHNCKVCAVWFGRVGYRPPWVCYIAFEGETCVGMCGYKTAPSEGTVEISYGTVKEHQGRGYATEMVRRLIELARRTAPDVLVTAQTLPENNASVRVLKKHGFKYAGEVQHPEDGLVWEWRLNPNPENNFGDEPAARARKRP